MKLIKKLPVLATLFGLSASAFGISLAHLAEKAPLATEAATASTSAAINFNGNVFARYVNQANNPDSWASAPNGDSDNVSMSDLDNNGTKFVPNADNLSSTAGFTVTGAGTSSMTFTETTASKNCIGLYIPLTFYFSNVAAYSQYTDGNLKFTLTLSGGTSSNYVVATAFNIGNPISSSTAYKENPTAFQIPKNASTDTFYGAVHAGQGGGAQVSKTSTSTILAQTKNDTDTAGWKACLYGGIFLGARKDSSNSHKIIATLSVTVSANPTSTTYAAINTNTGAYSSTLASAISSASAGDTIKLCRDTTVTTDGNTPVSIAKNLNLDFNGHTINNQSGFSVSSGVSFNLQGTGTLTGNGMSNGLIKNAGTTTIPSTITLNNTSANYYPAIINEGGTCNVAGTVSSKGDTITVKGGTVKITAGSVTSSGKQAIRLTKGAVYLSGASTSVSGVTSDIVLSNASDAKLYGYNGSTTYYTGSTINVSLETAPETKGIVVINKAYASGKFNIVTNGLVGLTYSYNSTDKTVVSSLTGVKISYSANGGSGTMAASTQNDDGTITIATSTFTKKYYSFSSWNTASDGSGSAYTKGANIRIASSITLYVQWYQSSADQLSELSEVYLKIGTYTVGDGSCHTYYAAAKEYYNNMGSGAKSLLAYDSAYTAIANRLAAWADANGETFDKNAKTFVAKAAIIDSNYAETNLPAILALAGMMVLVPGAFFVLRKKAHR